MADNSQYVQIQSLFLSGSGIGTTETSIILTSMKYPDRSTNVVMADFGTTGHATLEPGSEREENISFTGITQNANGTATLTGVTRGLGFKTPYTTVTALKLSHAGGTSCVVSNSAPFYDKLAAKDNDETVTGTWTFTSTALPTLNTYVAPTLNAQLAAKKYVDDVALAGTPDATTVNKGNVEVATDAELAAGTATGGTGASLAAIGSSFNTAGTANKVPVGNAGGKLAASWGGSASTLATLDSSTLVVQNPANATATATASKIPIAGGTGKLAEGWLQMTDAQATTLTTGSTSDASSLHTHAFIPEMEVPFYVGTNTNLVSNCRFGSSITGDIAFIAHFASGTVNILRLLRDTFSQQYVITHTTTYAGTSVSGCSVAVTTTHMFLCMIDNGVKVVNRYAIDDLTGVQLMTVSGTTYGDADAAFSDGTDLFIFTSADVFNKYTISGTTITFSSAITYTSGGNFNSNGAACNGTNVWMTANTTGTITIRKFALAGGAATASVVRTMFPDAYPNTSGLNLFIPKIGAIGVAYSHSAESNSAVTGGVVKLMSIVQP